MRAGAVTVFGSGVSMLLGMVVRMVIARVYGPEGMGKYAGFLMFLSLFGTLASFALPRAVLKFVAEYEEDRQLERIRKLFSSVFIFLSLTCILVAVVAQLFTPALARLVNLPADRTMALLLGLALILATQSKVVSSLFLGLLQNIRAVIISVSSLLAMLALAAYAYLINPPPVYFLLVGGYLVSAMLGVFLAYRQGLLKLQFSGEEIRRAFGFALPIIFMSYVGFFAEWFDRFALGMYFGVKEMGLFSAGLVVFAAARRLPLSLTDVLVPSYSKISLGGNEALGRAYGKNIYYYSIVFFFVAGFMVLFREEIVTVLFTKEFLPAADILLIMSGSFILSVIANPGSALLVGCGRTKINTINYLVGVIVLIPCLLIFTRHWGIRGAALAKILSHLTTTVGMLFILTRAVRLKIPFLPLLKVLGLMLVSTLVTALSRPLICFFPIRMLLMVVLYSGGLWLIVLTPEDKDYLAKVFHKLTTGREMLREPGIKWGKDSDC